MASILDVGLVSIFSAIFVFLLVYALVWGALSRLKWFGDKSAGPNAMIAFSMAILMAIAPPARNLVMFLAPWYLALAIILFFVLFIVSLFGLKADKDFPEIIKQGRVYIWIVILCVIIAMAGIAFTFGQSAYDAGQGRPTTTAPPTDSNMQVVGQGNPYYPPGTVVEGGTAQNPTYGTGYPTAGQPGSTATPSFQQNFLNTLLHPKVLGLIITMFIAAVAIYFLSSG
jgi:hypothetical protein